MITGCVVLLWLFAEVIIWPKENEIIAAFRVSRSRAEREELSRVQAAARSAQTRQSRDEQEEIAEIETAFRIMNNYPSPGPYAIFERSVEL